MDEGGQARGRRSLEELAEDARALADGRGEAWLDLADVSLMDSPGSPLYWYHQAHRVRFEPATADRRIAEVRAWFEGRGRVEWCWMIGPSTTPADLAARLMSTGAVLEGDEPTTVLVLDHEPGPAPTGIVVRRVESEADRRVYDAIRAAAFGFSAAERREEDDAFEARWAGAASSGDVAFIARHGGVDGAVGSMEPIRDGAWMLYGAGTDASMRGRGLFRALVRARWDESVARGGTGLIVDAKPTSAPILQSLGFRPVARITRLIDRA